VDPEVAGVEISGDLSVALPVGRRRVLVVEEEVGVVEVQPRLFEQAVVGPEHVRELLVAVGIGAVGNGSPEHQVVAANCCR
jgi:hypothetical protein